MSPAVTLLVGDSGKTPQAYVASAFELSNVTLHTGERMTVANATDPCMALARARAMITATADDLDLADRASFEAIPWRSDVAAAARGAWPDPRTLKA